MSKLRIINVSYAPEGVVIDAICGECGLELQAPLATVVTCDQECGGTEYSFDENEFDFSYDYSLYDVFQVRLQEEGLR